ncbi:MAG: DUF1489 family protein [Rhodospirillales bacterium]
MTSLPPLHLIKLCVGADSVDDLARWQASRLLSQGRIVHVTRMRPKRAGEILSGGSIYWVIKGVVQVRQRIVDMPKIVDSDGRAATELVLDNVLVAVRPRSHRAFQGWRYLSADDAPEDLVRSRGEGDALPPELASELADLGLL